MLVRCWGLLACLDWRLAIGHAHSFQITQHLRLDFTNHYQGRIAFHGLNSVSRNHFRGCGSPSWTQGYCHFSLGCPRANSLTDIWPGSVARECQFTQAEWQGALFSSENRLLEWEGTWTLCSLLVFRLFFSCRNRSSNTSLDRTPINKAANHRALPEQWEWRQEARLSPLRPSWPLWETVVLICACRQYQ